MLSTKPIREEYGDNICRRCINHEYRVKLSRGDCRYSRVDECPCCHSLHHIVTGFKIPGLMKMLFK